MKINFAFVRRFASKKSKPSAVAVTGSDFNFAPHQAHLEQSISHLTSIFNQMHVGRANPSLLDKVMITVAEKRVSLATIAQIHVKDGNSLMVVLPDENIAVLSDKAIRAADLGFNPQKVGLTSLLVPLPKATGDSRKEMVKTIKEEGEKYKVGMRKVRQSARKDLADIKKSMTADIFKKEEKNIDTLLDIYTKKIDILVSQKEKELK